MFSSCIYFPYWLISHMRVWTMNTNQHKRFMLCLKDDEKHSVSSTTLLAHTMLIKTIYYSTFPLADGFIPSGIQRTLDPDRKPHVWIQPKVWRSHRQWNQGGHMTCVSSPGPQGAAGVPGGDGLHGHQVSHLLPHHRLGAGETPTACKQKDSSPGDSLIRAVCTFILSPTQTDIHSFNHKFTHSNVHTCKHLQVHRCIHTFMRACLDSPTDLFRHTPVRHSPCHTCLHRFTLSHVDKHVSGRAR